jgi:hypothetical protein
MQAVVLWGALLTVALFPDTEYASPAYANRGAGPEAVEDWCKREVLVLCVRAGLAPDWVERLFGPPLLTSRFRAGPVEWWYPRLGVTIYWPARLFKPACRVERVQGGMQ